MTLTRSTLLRAVGYRIEDSASTASHTVAVRVAIRVTAPEVTVVECVTIEGTILYSAGRVYAGETCETALVRVSAMRAGEGGAAGTLLRYVVNSESALGASNPQGQGSVTATVVQSGVVRAVAWVPGLETSHVVASPFITISTTLASAALRSGNGSAYLSFSLSPSLLPSPSSLRGQQMPDGVTSGPP